MTEMKLSVNTGSRILEEHLPDFTSKFAESDILINIVHDFSDEKPLIIQLQFHCQPIKSPLANTSSGLVTFTRDLVTPVKYCWQHADKEYHPRPLQSKTLAADLERELFNPELANWTLVCEGTELPCNTFMLGTRSPVFKAMFSQTGFVENQEKRTEISDITLSTAKALLRFIYTDEVTLTEVNVSKLFIAAHKYDIPHLSYICSKHMLESIAVDNAAYYFALGHLYDDPEMKSATSRFIAENIKQVKETSGWQGLKEDLAALEELTTELCTIASQI